MSDQLYWEWRRRLEIAHAELLALLKFVKERK